MGVQAGGRKNRVGWTACWAWKLGGGYRLDGGGQSRRLYDLFREVIPGAVAGVGGMHNAGSVLMDELRDGRGEVGGKGRRAALIIDDRKLWGAAFGLCGSEFQNRCGEALASMAEEPRRSRDADVRQHFEQLLF